MANSFLSEYVAGIGNTLETIYTCPSSTQTTIIGLTLSNVTATSPIYADVVLDGTGRTSGATDSVYVVKAIPILSGSTAVIVGGDQKVVMEPGDVLKVRSDTASSIDCVMSHLDIT